MGCTVLDLYFPRALYKFGRKLINVWDWGILEVRYKLAKRKLQFP